MRFSFYSELLAFALVASITSQNNGTVQAVILKQPAQAENSNIELSQTSVERGTDDAMDNMLEILSNQGNAATERDKKKQLKEVFTKAVDSKFNESEKKRRKNEQSAQDLLDAKKAKDDKKRTKKEANKGLSKKQIASMFPPPQPPIVIQV